MNSNPTTPTAADMKSMSSFAMAMLLAVSSSGQVCLAQGAMDTLSEASSLASSNESLLPPEVVPLDPDMANQMVQAQSQNRAASMVMPATQGTISPVVNGMQSAQDFRQAAFNHLTGNQTWNGQYPGQAGFNPAQAPFPPPAGANPNILGQSPLVTSNAGMGQSPLIQPGAPQNLPGNQVAMPHQSQTLTGGVNRTPVRRDIRRRGFSNALSALAGFGSGVFVGSILRRPNTGLGLGLMGLGMTGFGTRNAFRF